MADKALYSLLIDLKADTASLQRDMDKAVGILQKSGRLMNNAVSGFVQGFGQVAGGQVLSSIGRLSSALTDLADEGDKVSGIVDNFEKLGGSSSAIKEAQKAILGTVSAFDLMRAANEGMIRGIPNLNQNFAQLVEFANRFADANEKETLPVLNELINAIATGSEKALKPFGFQLQEGATKAENMATAMDQLPQVMGKLAPLGKSLTSAYEGFNVAINDARKNIGMGVNDTEALADAYIALADAVNKINWYDVGKSIGEAMQLAGASISIFSSSIDYAANQLDKLRVSVLELGNTKPALVAASDALGLDFPFVDAARANWQKKQAAIQKERARVDSEGMSILLTPLLKGLVSTIGIKPAPKSTNPPVDSGRGKSGGGNGGGGRGGGGAANSAAQAARDLAQTQSQFRSFLETDVRNALSDSIKNVDQAAFDSLKEKLRTSLEQSYIESNQKFVDAKLMSMDELTAKAKKVAAEEVDEYSSRMSKAYDERANDERKLADEQIRAAEAVARIHEQAVGTWRGFWQQTFSGQAIEPNLKQVMLDVATGFASELSAGLFGELKSGGDIFFGLGQLIASGFGNGVGKMGGAGGGGGSGFGSIVNAIGNYFGDSGSYQSTLTTAQAYGAGIQGPGLADGSFGGNMTTGQAHAAGIQGPGMPDGSFSGGGSSSGSGLAGYGGYLQAGVATIGAAVNAKGIDKRNGDNSGTGGAVGSGGGAAIGAIFGPQGAMIGGTIGQIVGTIVGGFLKRGPQNKETQARHTFANWMEDFLQKDRFMVFDQNNRNPQRLTNFVEGASTRFNDPNWGAEMQKQSKEVQATFKGLGNAIKDILGITEDVGDQMAFLLGENLKYNINNARHLVKQLGLSFEEIQDKLVNLGRTGKMTWLEVETGLQGASEAFKPGLVEQGAVDLAVNNLRGSGATGFTAIQSIRDLAVEAREAGAKSIEDLRRIMLERGMKEEEVNMFMKAFAQRGIDTLEKLENADDRTAGGVVADLDAAGFQFQRAAEAAEGNTDAINKAGGFLQDATSALRDLTGAIRESNGKSAKSYADEEPVEGYATGGVVFGPKRGLMGENGPEAILPLTRRNGKMGVSFHGLQNSGGGYVVNIDARGAGAGVEGRIRSAMKEAEDRAVRRIMRATRYSQGRTN